MARKPSKLGKHQLRYFDGLKRGEIEDTIRDINRQMDAIMFSETKAASDKREELQARIDYLKGRLKTL